MKNDSFTLMSSQMYMAFFPQMNTNEDFLKNNPSLRIHIKQVDKTLNFEDSTPPSKKRKGKKVIYTIPVDEWVITDVNNCHFYPSNVSTKSGVSMRPRCALSKE